MQNQLNGVCQVQRYRYRYRYRESDFHKQFRNTFFFLQIFDLLLIGCNLLDILIVICKCYFLTCLSIISQAEVSPQSVVRSQSTLNFQWQSKYNRILLLPTNANLNCFHQSWLKSADRLGKRAGYHLHTWQEGRISPAYLACYKPYKSQFLLGFVNRKCKIFS